MKDLFGELERRRELGAEHHFTVLFTPEWGDFIVEDEGRRIEVGAWVAAGHELGFHHHTAGHYNPDGYGADVVSQDPSLCGATCDLASAVGEVRSMITHPDIGGLMRTANMGPIETDYAMFHDDWTADFAYATVAYPARTDASDWYTAEGALHGERECLQAAIYPDVRAGNVVGIPHAQYFAEDDKWDAVPLSAVTDAIDSAPFGTLVGLVWHEDAYSGEGASRVDSLLDELEARAMPSRTVSEVIGRPGC